MDRELTFLQALAERPFDRGLRLVFADWLLERGDERGEVIGAGVNEPSLTERRRLARIVERNARTWLGPLAEFADSGLSRFEGGFLTHLVCLSKPRSDTWARLTGELRLATVTNLGLPVGSEVPELVPFVRHPVLRHVVTLHASSVGWAMLGDLPQTLETVSVGSWGVFHGEFEALRGRKARRLQLVTSEFVNPLIAAEVRDAVLGQLSALSGFEEVGLVVRFGVVEGAVAWLSGGGDDGLVGRWPGTTFSVEYGDTRFSLRRSGETLRALTVDVEHGGDLAGLGQRLATAAAVLVQLAPLRLEAVEVQVPAGARLRPQERDALRAAARRLGSVKSFSLGGLPLSP